MPLPIRVRTASAVLLGTSLFATVTLTYWWRDPHSPSSPSPATPAITCAGGMAAELPKIDRVLDKEMKHQRLAGVVAGVAKKNFQYTTAFGMEHIEANVALQADASMLRWGSMSKTLVGVVAAKLAAEGRVDLDADITTILDGFSAPTERLVCNRVTGYSAARRYPGNSNNTDCLKKVALEDAPNITLRLLLAHRAGIEHYNNGISSPVPPTNLADDETVNTGMEWAVKFFSSHPLVALPGEVYSYSTPGFLLAAVVLEKATGTEFSELVATHVSSPLGLCSLRPDYEWEDIPRRAHGYESADGADVGSNDVSWKLAAGGWISTMDDLVRYGQALMEDTAWISDDVRFNKDYGLWVDRRHFTTDIENREMQYSMGFSQHHDGPELSRVWHSGSQQKSRTMFELHRPTSSKLRYSVYTMSNSENADTDDIVSALRREVKSVSKSDSCLPSCKSTMMSTVLA